MSNNPKILSSIRPRKNPAEDRLNHAGFAKGLATSISNMMPPEGLVLAIYGDWGSGKSTVIEFIRWFLKEECPKNQQPIVMPFNPWWFSGQEGLVRHFFEELEAIIANRRNAFGHGVKELAKSVRKLSDMVAAVPLPTAGLPKELANFIPDLDAPRQVERIRDEIANKLRKANRHILVIMDDIDRLTAEEIKQIFSLIKAVADFPNVVYLLAFDRNVVEKALSSMPGIDGGKYLEKIVQVSFDLPVADKSELQELLLENLKHILGEIPERLLDKSRPPFFAPTGFLTQIIDFIDTPRDVLRLCNALSVTFPAVQNEVNIADFVAIESLRILAPDLHDLIKDSKNVFLGKPRTEALKAQIVESVNARNDGEVVGRIVSDLFPGFGAWTYAKRDDLGWRHDLRICSDEFFDIYFRLSIPTNSVSNVVVQAILAATSDPTRLTAVLTEFATQNPHRLLSLLYRLHDAVQREFPKTNVPTVIQVLLDIGDELASPDDDKSFNEYRAAIYTIIRFLLQQIETIEQMEILKQNLTEGRADLLGIIVVSELLREYSKDLRDRDPLLVKRELTPDEKKILEQLALTKIRKVLSSNWSFDGNCRTAFFAWMTIEPEGAREWLKLATHEAVNFVSFLKPFVMFTSPDRFRITDDNLFRYMERSVIIGRLKALESESPKHVDPAVLHTILVAIETYQSKE